MPSLYIPKTAEQYVIELFFGHVTIDRHTVRTSSWRQAGMALKDMRRRFKGCVVRMRRERVVLASK